MSNDYPDRIRVGINYLTGEPELAGTNQADAREYVLVPEPAALDIDWSSLPDEAECVARDRDGTVFWFAYNPIAGEAIWLFPVGNCDFIRKDPPDPNWRSTLARRPR